MYCSARYTVLHYTLYSGSDPKRIVDRFANAREWCEVLPIAWSLQRTLSWREKCAPSTLKEQWGLISATPFAKASKCFWYSWDNGSRTESSECLAVICTKDCEPEEMTARFTRRSFGETLWLTSEYCCGKDNGTASGPLWVAYVQSELEFDSKIQFICIGRGLNQNDRRKSRIPVGQVQLVAHKQRILVWPDSHPYLQQSWLFPAFLKNDCWNH